MSVNAEHKRIAFNQYLGLTAERWLYSQIEIHPGVVGKCLAPCHEAVVNFPHHVRLKKKHLILHNLTKLQVQLINLYLQHCTKRHLFLLLQICVSCFVSFNSHLSSAHSTFVLWQRLCSQQLWGNVSIAVHFVLIKPKCLMLIAGQSVRFNTVTPSLPPSFISVASWPEQRARLIGCIHTHKKIQMCTQFCNCSRIHKSP